MCAWSSATKFSSVPNCRGCFARPALRSGRLCSDIAYPIPELLLRNRRVEFFEFPCSEVRNAEKNVGFGKRTCAVVLCNRSYTAFHRFRESAIDKIVNGQNFANAFRSAQKKRLFRSPANIDLMFFGKARQFELLPQDSRQFRLGNMVRKVRRKKTVSDRRRRKQNVFVRVIDLLQFVEQAFQIDFEPCGIRT